MLLHKIDHFLKKPLTESKITSFYKIKELSDLSLLYYRYRDCYANAFRFAWFYPNLSYIEGITIKKKDIFHHAWNKIGDKYFDITWECMNDKQLFYYQYFPIIEVCNEDLILFKEQLILTSDSIYNF